MLSRKSLRAAVAAMAIVFFVPFDNNVLGGNWVPGNFLTYAQVDWGDETMPATNSLLSDNFVTLYRFGLSVGGTFSMLFTEESAIQIYLAAVGPPGPLDANHGRSRYKLVGTVRR